MESAKAHLDLALLLAAVEEASPLDAVEVLAAELVRLVDATHVSLLPGRYLAREARGVNPGSGYVRIALVPDIDACVEAARRIVEFCR